MKKLTKEQVFSALFAEVMGRNEDTRVVYYLYVKEDGTIVDDVQKADACLSAF